MKKRKPEDESFERHIDILDYLYRTGHTLQEIYEKEKSVNHSAIAFFYFVKRNRKNKKFMEEFDKGYFIESIEIQQEKLDKKMKKRKLELAKAKAIALMLLQKQNKKTTSAKPKVNIVNSSRQAILDMPVRNIFTDEKRFQNRKNAFSQESANRIVNAVANKTFDWAKFDPIIIWRDDKQQHYFVLSGHSRLAAFQKLSKEFSEFEEIPVKIFKGTEEQAIELALTSNTLSTKETDVERAMYWANRRKRCEITKGLGLGAMNVCEKEIANEIKEIEGKNSNYILNLSYLNPNGFLIDSLTQLGIDRDNESTNTYRTIANWIGEARKRNPEISDIQETEISKFLLNGGYGNKKYQFSNKTKFNERLKYSFDKWKKNGANPKKPLNLANTLSKSSFENEYDLRLERAKKELNEVKELHSEKYNKYLDALIDGKITQERMDELMMPHVIAVQKATAEVKRIQGRKQEVLEAAKSQTALFGIFLEEENEKAIIALDKVIAEKTSIHHAFCVAEIGCVSLIYGKKGNENNNYKGGYGISHIIAKRQREYEQKQKGLNGVLTVYKLLDVIIYGKISKTVEAKQTIHITRHGYEAVLSLNWFGDSLVWLLTGYKINNAHDN